MATHARRDGDLAADTDGSSPRPRRAAGGYGAASLLATHARRDSDLAADTDWSSTPPRRAAGAALGG